MAELSAVFNLAYMELRSTRHLKQAIRLVHETAIRLDGKAEETRTASINPRAAEFVTQLHNMFSRERNKRCAAWRTVNDAGETREEFEFSAKRIYPLFAWSANKQEGKAFFQYYSNAENDAISHHPSLGKAICAWCLGITVAILVICTVLAQIQVGDLLITIPLFSAPMSTVWCVFFAFLLFSIAWPATLVLLGRKMAKDAETIAASIKAEYERLEQSVFAEKTKTSA